MVFFLSFISILTSYLTKHDYFHNIVLHAIGLLSFFITLNKNSVFKSETKYLLILICFSIVGLYIFKNHDDFPYYHLTYSLSLTENNFLIGAGAFSHGFRTFSSLFYFNSITFLPGIKYFYLLYIHIWCLYFLILLF